MEGIEGVHFPRYRGLCFPEPAEGGVSIRFIRAVARREEGVGEGARGMEVELKEVLALAVLLLLGASYARNLLFGGPVQERPLRVQGPHWGQDWSHCGTCEK